MLEKHGKTIIKCYRHALQWGEGFGRFLLVSSALAYYWVCINYMLLYVLLIGFEARIYIQSRKMWVLDCRKYCGTLTATCLSTTWNAGLLSKQTTFCSFAFCHRTSNASLLKRLLLTGRQLIHFRPIATEFFQLRCMGLQRLRWGMVIVIRMGIGVTTHPISIHFRWWMMQFACHIPSPVFVPPSKYAFAFHACEVQVGRILTHVARLQCLLVLRGPNRGSYGWFAFSHEQSRLVPPLPRALGLHVHGSEWIDGAGRFYVKRPHVSILTSATAIWGHHGSHRG